MRDRAREQAERRVGGTARLAGRLGLTIGTPVRPVSFEDRARYGTDGVVYAYSDIIDHQPVCVQFTPGGGYVWFWFYQLETT